MRSFLKLTSMQRFAAWSDTRSEEMKPPPDLPQSVEEIGGGAWTRTTDLRIMSRQSGADSKDLQQDSSASPANSCKIRNPRATTNRQLLQQILSKGEIFVTDDLRSYACTAYYQGSSLFVSDGKE